MATVARSASAQRGERRLEEPLGEAPRSEEPLGEPREALDKVGKIITDLLDTPVVHRGAFEAACGLVRRALAEREPSLRALIAADLAALERDNKRA